MSDFGEPRNHEPTPRYAEMVGRQSSAPPSQSLAGASSWLMALGLLLALGSQAAGQLGTVSTENWAEISLRDLSGAGHVQWVQESVWQLLAILAPLLLAMFIAAISIQWLQSGFRVRWGRVFADFSRLDPLDRCRRAVSRDSLVRLGLSVVQILVLVGVMAVYLLRSVEEIAAISVLPAAQLATAIARQLLGFGFVIGMAFLALGVIEFAILRWLHWQSLKMTDQQFREEMRLVQANPLIVSRRRQMHRHAAGQRVETR